MAADALVVANASRAAPARAALVRTLMVFLSSYPAHCPLANEQLHPTFPRTGKNRMSSRGRKLALS
jgi:hypothetical protein